MRSRREIEKEVDKANSDTGNYEEESNILLGLIIEVLLDIRDNQNS